MDRLRRTCLSLPLALLLMMCASPASAFLSVGPAPCAFRTVQGAIDALLASQRSGDFFDNLIIVGPGTFNEALTIDGSGIAQGALVFITGGYDAGCNTPQAGSITTISAANRPGSVLTIHGHSAVLLDNLTLTGADTSGRGGGIDFDGTGTLDASRVNIFNNTAGYGAGIYANGQGLGIAINLHSGTHIVGNVALHAGGGIRIQGLTELVMNEPNSSITSNTARLEDNDGTGGGLQVIGPANAVIGPIDISSNLARYGGGIAAIADNTHHAAVVMTGVPSGERARITHNQASRTGGGIYATANFINSSGELVESSIKCSDCTIDGNTAQEGAAIYADTATDFTGLPSAGGNVVLVRSTVDNNIAATVGMQDTSGSTILIQSKGFFASHAVEIRGNRGGHVFRAFETVNKRPHLFENSLVTQNNISSSLFLVEGDGATAIHSSTIANNAIANGEGVLALSGNLDITASIIWQPGQTTLFGNDADERDIHYVIASEIDSLGGGNTFLSTFPGFVAMLAGDYTLRDDADALDFAPAAGGVDLAGNPRTVDLARPDRPGGGPLDLGAYERKAPPAFPPDEDFDEVASPTMAEGWIESHLGETRGWSTTTVVPYNGPNAAFVEDPVDITDATLTSPPVTIDHDGLLTFRHRLGLEPAYDGAVLEIAIGTGTFEDVVAAGGEFVQGGYTGNIPPDFGNPLAGRDAWEGSSDGAYRTVVVRLPRSADHQAARFRWRVGTDHGNSASGYWLDDVHIEVRGAILDRIFCNGLDASPCL